MIHVGRVPMDVCPTFYSAQMFFGGQPRTQHTSLQDKVVIHNASLCCLPLLLLRGPAVCLLSLRLQGIATSNFPITVASVLLALDMYSTNGRHFSPSECHVWVVFQSAAIQILISSVDGVLLLRGA